MRKVTNHNLFRWTLRGKPWFLLAGASLLLLILLAGVM